MIIAVLFDLDGTLLDRDATIRAFIEDQYDRFYKRLHTVPKLTFVNRFIELDQHGYVWKDKVYKRLIGELALATFLFSAYFLNKGFRKEEKRNNHNLLQISVIFILQ